MQTYETSPSWHRFRRLLADEFGIALRREPHESIVPVRGHELHLDEWRPDGEPTGTLILVHGGGGHGRVLAPLADVAAGLGWRTLAPDLPGYGLTRASASFRWDYAEWPAVVAALADSTEGQVVLMGLSLGGTTAVHAARAARSVRGVIATTLLDMRDPYVFARAARWRWPAAASLLGFRWMPGAFDRVRLPLALLAPMRRMSSSPALQAYFAGDPLLSGLRVPARFFRTMRALELHPLDPACPLLLLHPGDDRWTPTALSRPTFERIAGAGRVRELSNGAHMPLELPARLELQQEIADFLEAAARRV